MILSKAIFLYLFNASLAFQNIIPELSSSWMVVTDIDAVHRLDAKEQLFKLGTVIYIRCSRLPECIAN